jgi:hypothetical protein
LLLQKFGKNFQTIEKGVSCAEQLRELTDLNSAFWATLCGLFHRFSFNYVKNGIEQRDHGLLSSILSVVNRIIGDIDVDNDVYFEVMCTAFDSVEIGCCPELEDSFISVLNDFIDNEWRDLQFKPEYLSKRVLVLNIASKLSHLKDVGTGKVLKALLNFIGDMLVISGDLIQCQNLFCFAMIVASVTVIVPIFLFYHHFVFTRRQIVDRFGGDVHRNWGILSARMWNVLSRNKELMEKCSDYAGCWRMLLIDGRY